jgi:hypothetical protein
MVKLSRIEEIIMPPRKKAAAETSPDGAQNSLPAKKVQKPKIDEAKELAAEKRALAKEKQALEASRAELVEVQAQLEEDRAALAALWQEYDAAEKGALEKVKKLKAKLEKAEKKIKKLKKKK